MKDLTARQHQLLSFIEDYLKVHGFPPSIREMGDSMGVRSTNGINDHLKALEKKGYIVRGNDFKSRAISIKSRPPQPSSGPQTLSIAIPILGRVAAGTPILSEENFEGQFLMDRSLLPRGQNWFALKVRGDSMIEKGIFEGDLVIVNSQSTAQSGQIAVVSIDGEATVKIFKQEKDSVVLEPANARMQPIVIRKKDFRPTTILGVVIGVFRQLQQSILQKNTPA
jgi:repressor LexA